MANKLYEEEVIQDIAVAIREKTGKEDLMTIAEMPSEIRSITSGEGSGDIEINLQDMTITENGTYTADSDYDGLGTVTVNVQGSGGGSGDLPTGTLNGLENGWDVMFYDENNDALAFYSIKKEHTINPPVYNCKAWQTAEGTNVVFPYTPTADAIFYALQSSYADQLYEYLGVDKGVYPYMYINVWDSSIYNTVTVYIFKTYEVSNDWLYMTGGFYWNSSGVSLQNATSLELLVSGLMESNINLVWNSNAKLAPGAQTRIYTNFDISEIPNISGKSAGRLDE